MDLVGGVTRRVRARVHERRTAPVRAAGLERLRARPDGAALAAAIAPAPPAADERPWVERIEALRRELLVSEQRLTVRGSEYSGDPADDREESDAVGDLCRSGSRPPHFALMLLRLVRNHRPRVALELGTLLGLSAAYQAAGLELAGAPGRLLTMDASRERVDFSRRTLERLGLGGRVDIECGRFQATLAPALERLGAVDYAFVDGHHDGPATVGYTGAILDRASPGAVVVVDDTRWSAAMTQAWETLVADPRTGLAVDLGGMGILLAGGEPELVHVPIG